MSKLRIGLVAPHVSHNAFGVGASVGALCNELCNAGHDVTLICGDGPRSNGIPRPRRNGHGRLSLRLFPMRYAWNRRLHRAPGMRGWLQTAVRGFDVVDIHGIWSVVAAEAGAVCARAGVPYVITPHGMMASWDWAKGPLKKRIFFNIMMRKVWRSAAAIRFVSQGEATGSVLDANGKGVVIPNFVPAPPASGCRQEAERFRSKMGISSDAAVVLFLGRVSPEKGVMEMVEAFGKVSEKRHEAVLLVVGPLEGAYGAAVKDRVRCLPWRGNVRLAGPLFGEEKNAAFAASTVFMTLSESEGLPVAVLEALGWGLPTLLTEQANMPEVREFEAGLLVERRVESVATVLAGILDDRDRLDRMRTNAKALFHQRFTSTNIVPQILSLYGDVASGEHRGAWGADA